MGKEFLWGEFLSLLIFGILIRFVYQWLYLKIGG